MSKISELSNGGALLSTDDLIVVRSGGNVRAQLSSLNGIAIGSSTPAAGSFTTGSFSGNVTADAGIYLNGTNSNSVAQGNFLRFGTNFVTQSNSANSSLITYAFNGSTFVNALEISSSGIDVTGGVTADGLTVSTSGTNAEAYFDNGSQSYRLLNRSSDNAFSIFDNTSSAFRLTTASNGDISFYEDTGTTAKLSWSAANERLFLSGSDYQFGIGQGSNQPWYLRAISNGSFALHLNATGDILTATSTGLGIGCSPANSLEIQKTATGTGNGSNNTLALRYNSTTLYSQHYMDANGIYHILADASGSAGGNMQLDADATIRFATGSTPTERLRIDSSGNLIMSAGGTIRAGGANDLILDAGESGTPDIYLQSGGSTKVKIEGSNGNVGIGVAPTFTPGGSRRLLQVTNGSSGGQIALSNDSNESENPRIFADADNLGFATATTGGGFMQFYTAGSEAMRINGGLLMVSTSSDFASSTVDGIIAQGTNKPAAAFSNTAAGQIVKFYEGGSLVGSISSTDGTDLQIGSVNTYLRFDDATDQILPTNAAGTKRDGAIDLGDSDARFNDIYATNGTIQTSDRNEKQDIEALLDAEQRVAVAAKGLLRKFRWKSSVEEKGDDARIHFGIIAQDLQDAFTAEGLDAGRYAMFISSTWTDEETGEERTRLGVRYSELLAFIISAI